MATTLLVTGASGHLGRLALERLVADHREARVIATSRKPEALKDFAERGVEVRKADFDDDEAALSKAFAGADRLLLVSTDSMTGPLSRAKQHARAIEAAKRAGVKHIVYTSIVDASTSPIALAADHKATEAALVASGIGHTILRNNFYTELLLSTLPPAIASGKLFSAAKEGRIAYVARADCAAAAAEALASSFTGTRALDVTGPEALAPADFARIAADVVKKPIAVVPVTMEQLADGMKAAGLPAPVAEFYAAIDVAVSNGALARVGDGVVELTGKAPQSVRDFLAAHADALRGA